MTDFHRTNIHTEWQHWTKRRSSAVLQAKFSRALVREWQAHYHYFTFCNITRAQTVPMQPGNPHGNSCYVVFNCSINGCPPVPCLIWSYWFIPLSFWLYARIGVLGGCVSLMEENTRLGTYFTALLHWLGPCMLLIHLTRLGLLWKAQKHEIDWKHDNFHLVVPLSLCSVLLVFCFSFCSSLF